MHLKWTERKGGGEKGDLELSGKVVKFLSIFLICKNINAPTKKNKET